MFFEILHANFDYGNLSITTVQESKPYKYNTMGKNTTTSIMVPVYHLVDCVSNVDYDLEHTIVEVKEVNSENEFKWGRKAVAAAVGGVVLGPLGALAAGACFGNKKNRIVNITLSTGHKGQLRVDKEAFKLLQKFSQSNLSKAAKKIAENTVNVSNVMSNNSEGEIVNTCSDTKQNVEVGFISAPTAEKDVRRDKWLKKVRQKNGGNV